MPQVGDQFPSLIALYKAVLKALVPQARHGDPHVTGVSTHNHAPAPELAHNPNYRLSFKNPNAIEAMRELDRGFPNP
ncbi:hypothetical protein JCM8547_005493 [Rhodosporidiobolus lusitaniae]